MDRDYSRIEKTAEKCMRITCLIWLCLIMAAATLIVLLAVDAGLIGNIILAICWIFVIVYIVIAPKVRYERYRYCIDNEAIRVREGLFWISESVVPIERLHKIQVSQGPIARMFNLSTVCVTTAGGDVNIKFLPEEIAEEIAETLKVKINTLAVTEKMEKADNGQNGESEGKIDG